MDKDVTTLGVYNTLSNHPDVQRDAVKIASKMLKAAGRITPTELGAASAICLELALFIKQGGKHE